MKIIIDFQARSVRLTDERVQHILQHPEMTSMETALEQTLRDPEWVFQSKSDPSARLYYRYQRNTLFGDKWLCVVVKYADDPFMLTAYLTDAIKKGEELWRKK